MKALVSKVSLKRKAFTLIELVTSMAIASIIFLLLFNILHISILSASTSSDINENFLSSQYFREYVKEEIHTADAIIPLDTDRGNLGFLIVNIAASKTKEPYHYITYYLEEDKIYRYAFKSSRELTAVQNSNIFKTIPKGKNVLIDGVEDLQSKGVLREQKLIVFSYSLKNSGSNYRHEEKFAIRAPIK